MRVITKRPYTLFPAQSFMRGPNILKWIVTSFERRLPQASGYMTTSFVNLSDQLADIFTKSLRGPKIQFICNKLGAYDLYALA